MPSLAALRGFDAVARHGSYSAAAAALNVTEAALRQHVRKLEADLGQGLVERRGRGIELTEAGRAFAGSTRKAFDTLFAAVEDMIGDDARRPLKLALTPAFAENWLMPRLGEFWARHPEIELELVPSLRLEDLRAGRFDMAIRYGEGNWPGLDSVHLASAEYTVVARPEVARAHAVRDIADLRKLSWLFESGRQEHRLWADARGIDFDAEHYRHYPTNSLVLSALRAGQGVSLQARALIQRDLDAGILTEMYSEPRGALGYYVVTHSMPRPLARTFIAWLVEEA
ncbi:LysR family transcriptional regulator [Pelagibius sp. CAU 1746]|uniref:LysR family transcriptional regulator n=1 Tax=Pelagibius sp. CAU 1746 TaxID=3140370 RepID=UPI00325BAE6D